MYSAHLDLAVGGQAIKSVLSIIQGSKLFKVKGKSKNEMQEDD